MKSLKHMFSAGLVAAALAIAAPMANAGAMTDYLENKVVDWLLRYPIPVSRPISAIAFASKAFSASG
jgi:hypothetical protein